MKYIGAHVSAAGGVQNAPLNAQKIGANAFAFFTKNQRQWDAPPLDENSVTLFKENLVKAGIEPQFVLPHDSYLINIGNPDDIKRKRSLDALTDEAERTELLGLQLLNFHPGAHLGLINEEGCMDLIADGINHVLDSTDRTIMVIENTAGQGTGVGHRFEHLAYIISRVKDKNRVGVCIDTCHLFAAGYDIRTQETYSKTFADFDSIVGFEYLRGMHLNDAKSEYQSRVDRHNSLGAGKIGIDAFKMIMRDSRFDNMPLILETIDDSLWPKEIKMLRGFLG
ncbi:MAG TPA: deoxyribonuclease IV [Spirochaetota bacterium]|nr:deoxyribonuclease IV [Spirochaetota bacterium]